MTRGAEQVALGAEVPEVRCAAIGIAAPAHDLGQPFVDDNLPVAELVIGKEGGGARPDVLGGAPQQPAPLAEVEVELARREVAPLQRLDQERVKRLVPQQHVEHDLLDRRPVATPAGERDRTARRVLQPLHGAGRLYLQVRRRLRLHQRQQRAARRARVETSPSLPEVTAIAAR